MKIGSKYKELRKFLQEKYRGLQDIKSIDFKTDCKIAIWHYCKDWYNGQRDILYGILCSIKYRNSTGNINKEDYNIQNYYNSLVKEFQKGGN